MADDGICIVLVLVEEVGCARECNLVDIFVNLLLGHTDTAVADGYCALAKRNVNGKVAQFAVKLAFCSQSLQFLCCIYCV